MFHKILTDEAELSLPTQFNNPFSYTPHKLAIEAANKVRNYIGTVDEWRNELAKGKMFGVLVVQNSYGELGYLAAFSGLLDGKNNHPYFVPPIYDLTSPSSCFKKEESAISAINSEIKNIENSSSYKDILERLNIETERVQRNVEEYRLLMQQHKTLRDIERKEITITPERQAQLIKESQFEKAELKRITQRENQRLEAIREELQKITNRIECLKNERKERSAQLQEWLFRQFVILNSKGEESNLIDIFYNYNKQLPPAGAGECAAPKMLQYAFKNGYKPIQMAEFWVGASPVGEVRVDGNYYPSCMGKCFPILTYMLKGMDVAKIKRENSFKAIDIEILYEDDHLIAVNKPAGLLSIPGKCSTTSVEELMQERYPNARTIHRLDMATSGVLLLAKNISMYKAMQSLFARREVEKSYEAIVEGEPAKEQGEISLPLAPDYINRPAQRVDYERGKEAVTKYRVLNSFKKGDKIYSRMLLNPITGRTHQLRLHMSHPASLGVAIVGDEIYGTPDERLMLHATSLSFTHPLTKEAIKIEVKAPF